jgi:NAD(P)-dependent dehydrogenase (short-subunit alcohol dehydrogenase family)
VTVLDGRVALVTGASRGIGAAVADALVSAGAQVLGVARTVEEVPRTGFQGIRCDLTVATEVDALARRVLEKHGPPDIVVSNAGGFLLRPLADTTLAEFDSQIAVNLRAAFGLARAFLPAMVAAGRGCFISVGSVADHTGFPDNAAYAASKYGLRGIHETLVAEYRGSGVRLTLVSPGPTDTPIWEPFNPDHLEGFPARAEMLRARDVADAILFVATRPPHVHIDWLRLGPV